VNAGRVTKTGSLLCELVDRAQFQEGIDPRNNTKTLSNHVQLKVPLPLSAQLLLQHCEFAVQGALTGKQLAAAAAVGAMIEETNGRLTAAATPRRFIKARRDF
jgi:hypothetical protein